MRSLFLLVLSLMPGSYLFGQTDAANNYSPELVAQSGLRANIPANFAFSAKNNYLYGYNITGEYVFYDLKTNKQIKRIVSTSPLLSPLIYTPKPAFSKDEKLILIPQYPEGNYMLFDLVNNKTLKTFIPDEQEEKITHSLFSADGKSILLVLQKAGDQPEIKLRIHTTDGNLVKSCLLQSPPSWIRDASPAVRLLMKRQLNETKRAAQLLAVTATADLGIIYMGFMEGEALHVFNIGTAAANSRYELNSQTAIPLPKRGTINELAILGNSIVAKIIGRYTNDSKDIIRRTDTLVVLNPATKNIERNIISSMLTMADDHSSKTLAADIQTSNQALNIYFKSKAIGKYDYTVSCFDLLTDQEIFTYTKGDQAFYYIKRNIKGGQLNGGDILTLSDDQKYMVENASNILIHNLDSKKIRNSFSASRGGIKLDQPIFIDSFRLLIPKVTNDAFIFDLRTSRIDRLKRSTDCQDTARSGANTYWHIDESAVLGLENAAISDDRKNIAIINYRPADLCGFISGKQIDVYDDQFKFKKSHSFIDREFSYNLHFVPGKVPTFLAYYKLISFPENEQPVIHELKITQKKNVFYAANPIYLPATGTIFTIMGTRETPGSSDLIFAHYNLEGKLLKSFQFKRDKTPYQFQTLIYESQISPDGTKLLFGLHDGTAGIFDIVKMKMIRTYEHGDAMWIKLADVYEHNSIMSACFIDNNNFVTAGDDGKVRLWNIDQPKPLRVINQDPAFMYGVTLSPDKRFLVGPDAEKNIRFIDIKTGETSFRIYSPDYESAAIVSKEGYYTGNKKVMKSLSFLHNARAFDFSQFDLYLNRPDKILEKIGYASPETIANYQKAHNKRMEKLGVAVNNKKFAPAYQAPEISIRNLPEELSETSESKLKLSITANDASSVITTLFVNVNGVPLYGIKGQRLKQTKTGSWDIPLEIPLSYGNNVISISVMNKNGAESLSENINIKRLGIAAKPNLHIIAIGSGAFNKKFNKDLEFPAKDAKDITELFASSPLFGSVQKTILTNEQVTRPAFMKLKEKLLKTGTDDYVIVFYSGHGILDKNLNYYLSTYDTDFDNPKTRSLAYDDLEYLLDSIPSRNKILLLDACHSGEADKESLESDLATKGTMEFEGGITISKKTGNQVAIGQQHSFDLMQSLFSDLRVSNGATIIAAASASQVAVESKKWNNGVFTYAIKNGMQEKKADLNKDGAVHLSELLEYLQQSVISLTNGQQQPCSRKENIINDLLVWQ